jgi:hypothetical protein
MKIISITKKRVSLLILFGVLLMVTACKPDNRTVPRIITEKQSFDFQREIRPIIDNKCIACHACYDAPCQLKMQSADGVIRGGSKIQVYNGLRLEDVAPTRLYVDAQTTEEWRNMGFYSVLEKQLKPDDENNNHSLFKNMIELAKKNPLPANKKIPENIELGLKRNNVCPAPGEFSDYARDNPHGGMPLAVTGLSTKEAGIITTWINEGAKTTPKQIEISPRDSSLIQHWETWLNSSDKRTALVARYLFEHLFLGHLYLGQPNFEAGIDAKVVKTKNVKSIQFYELVRSYSPSGQIVQPVKTVRPFDDPQKPFYYRLKPIEETIVHKTHITYRFDEQRLNHFKQLFLQPEWKLNSLPGYSYTERSNPFLTYQAIPASIRYRFMLDDAEFFVRNFIRGPVCRGQIATNVIRDQFWVMFEDPNHELYTNDSDYQKKVDPYLGLPGENTSLIKLGNEWVKYSKKRDNYLDIRQDAYQKTFPLGANKQHIWNGDKTNTNAFLSIFRHHDSASVTKGWIGELPQTTWLMDYPLLERTYYELVASFDVFGSVSHQAQTRLYFDLIRNGSELNFLRLLPADSRSDLYESWYQSAAKIKTEISYHPLDKKSPTAIKFNSTKPYNELLEIFLNQYPQLTKKQDKINRCDDTCREKLNTKSPGGKIYHALSTIAALPASGIPAIKWLPEVSFIRIEQPDKQVLAYTLLRNRRHSSVSFMLGESLRYEEQRDSLTIIPKLIGSYPNLMFSLKSTDIDDFVLSLKKVDSEEGFNSLIDRWGVRRMNPNFWNVLHGFSQIMDSHQPLESGIYDINRYGRW